jgi:hypothetical protein
LLFLDFSLNSSCKQVLQPRKLKFSLKHYLSQVKLPFNKSQVLFLQGSYSIPIFFFICKYNIVNWSLGFWSYRWLHALKNRLRR